MAEGKLNVSRFHSVPPSEIAPLAEKLVREVDPDAVETLVALFRNRAMRLIRSGSTSDLREEASVLNRHLYSAAGRAMLHRDAVMHGRLQMIAEMEREASQRTDAMFLSSVLSSHSRYARPIIEMLSRAGSDGVARQKILTDLKIPSESYLSHILADLEEADVVMRLRRPGSKGVRVVLGPAGHDLVRTKLLPEWFRSMIDMLNTAIRERRMSPPSKIAATLEKQDVPSRLFVDHFITVLETIAGKGRTGNEAGATVGAPAR